jgi:hypothetical protein
MINMRSARSGFVRIKHWNVISNLRFSTFSSYSVQEGGFRLELLDFFEQLGPGRGFPVGVTRLFRATRFRKGFPAGIARLFRATRFRKEVPGWNCSTFSSNSVQEVGFRWELLDFFEQLGPGRGVPAGIARLFRATRSRKGVSGWNCSTFSSNSVQEGGFRWELLDFWTSVKKVDTK